MTDLDRQRIATSIGEAFSILCVRVGGSSKAESNLRLGFESILRELGTPPLRVVSEGVPLAYRRGAATNGELHYILKALDSCLIIFQRYDSTLTPVERRIQLQVDAARRFAGELLAARKRVPEMALV